MLRSLLRLDCIVAASVSEWMLFHSLTLAATAEDNRERHCFCRDIPLGSRHGAGSLSGPDRAIRSHSTRIPQMKKPLK